MEVATKFLRPVHVGDTLHVEVRLQSKRMTSKPDRGVVVTAHDVVNQRGEIAVHYESTRMIRTRAYVEAPA